MSALHTKVRPSTLSEIVGQKAVVRSLKQLLESNNRPHTFLFSGPSGVGKTTLARIIASKLHCEVLEIDAASHTGIDDMRAIMETLPFRNWDKDRPNRCVILDECHSLSKQSWQSLLKVVEEPPSHVYFCFCTTEIEKVPKTIVTRAHHYALGPISSSDLLELLEDVVKREKIKIKKEVLDWLVRISQGSARQALVYLSMCHMAKSEEEAKQLANQSAGAAEGIEMFRALVSGRADWKQCITILQKIEGKPGFSYESLRIQLVNYVAVVLLRSKNNPTALLAILEAFSQPLPQSTGRAGFLLALGSVLFD